MAISRWDPFRELMQMEREMERLLGGTMLRGMPRRGERLSETMTPGIDVWETNDSLIVQAAMPGVQPDDLQVSVGDNTLTIRGEVRQQQVRDGDRWHRQEIQYGVFENVITLPPYANTEQVEANYENGMVMLRFPKREQARSRQIPVKAGTGQPQRTIEGRMQQGGQPQGQPSQGTAEQNPQNQQQRPNGGQGPSNR